MPRAGRAGQWHGGRWPGAPRPDIDVFEPRSRLVTTDGEVTCIRPCIVHSRFCTYKQAARHENDFTEQAARHENDCAAQGCRLEEPAGAQPQGHSDHAQH
jgi:hypothetical protein